MKKHIRATGLLAAARNGDDGADGVNSADADGFNLLVARRDICTTGRAVVDVIARDPATDGSEGAAPLPFIINYDTVADCPAP